MRRDAVAIRRTAAAMRRDAAGCGGPLHLFHLTANWVIIKTGKPLIILFLAGTRLR